jgi:hypothetical protein
MQYIWQAIEAVRCRRWRERGMGCDRWLPSASLIARCQSLCRVAAAVAAAAAGAWSAHTHSASALRKRGPVAMKVMWWCTRPICAHIHTHTHTSTRQTAGQVRPCRLHPSRQSAAAPTSASQTPKLQSACGRSAAAAAAASDFTSVSPAGPCRWAAP